MANLVFGQLYPQLWLENHVKSLLDPTNLQALCDDYVPEYVVFTDDETLNAIKTHPNFIRLGQTIEINVVRMEWPADADRFASRYALLAQMFQQTLAAVLQPKVDPRNGATVGPPAWAMSVWVADLVFAKHALPRMLKRLEDGHDAVFNVPIRSAADSLNHVLAALPGAPSDLELFEMAYANLHHLWVASHWDSPLFSKFPYSMLWNSGTGLLAHNFGVTPIVFKPNAELQNVQGVIDADVPAFFKNPFWATDWTDAPVAGVEPLSNGHYPPFLQHRAAAEWVTEWALHGGPERVAAIHPSQTANLPHPLYYPSRERFNDKKLAQTALALAKSIQAGIARG